MGENENRGLFRSTYALGDTVYRRLAQEKEPGLIVGIIFRPSGYVYLVAWATGGDDQHFELELSTEYVPEWAQENEDARKPS